MGVERDCRRLDWQREAIAAVRARGRGRTLAAVYAAFARYVNAEGLCWPGLVTIAQEVGIGGSDRTAVRNLQRRYLAPLVSMGALEVVAEGDGRGRRTVWRVVNLRERGVMVTALSGPKGGSELSTERAVIDAQKGRSWCRERAVIVTRKDGHDDRPEEGEEVEEPAHATGTLWIDDPPPVPMPASIRAQIDDALPRRAALIVARAMRAEAGPDPQRSLFDPLPVEAT